MTTCRGIIAVLALNAAVSMPALAAGDSDSATYEFLHEVRRACKSADRELSTIWEASISSSHKNGVKAIQNRKALSRELEELKEAALTSGKPLEIADRIDKAEAQLLGAERSLWRVLKETNRIYDQLADDLNSLPAEDVDTAAVKFARETARTAAEVAEQLRQIIPFDQEQRKKGYSKAKSQYGKLQKRLQKGLESINDSRSKLHQSLAKKHKFRDIKAQQAESILNDPGLDPEVREELSKSLKADR